MNPAEPSAHQVESRPTRVGEPQLVPLAELHLWDRNPRRITTAAFERLLRSMQTDPDMLLARPVIALRDGRVVAGNMRLRAAQHLEWTSIPTVYADLDEPTAASWALRDNNPYGEWEEEALSALLHEMQDAGLDLLLTGFGDDDLARLLADTGEPTAVERAGELQLADVSIGDPHTEVHAGDVWQLGKHLLVCASVYDGWPTWMHLLEQGDLLCPYPTPTLPLTERASRTRLVMVQPDPWLAGHVVDKYASVKGDAEVQRR